MRKIDRMLQTAATSGNGTAAVLENSGELTFYIYTSGTVSAGAIQLEEAHSSAYADTWEAIGDAITPVDATVIAVHVSGVFGVVRARISTAITGGATVNVRLLGLIMVTR